MEENGQEKLGSLKPKIAPKVPVRRKKVEVKQVKERVIKERKPRIKKEVEMVASGPFAMGPAQRGKKIQTSHTVTQIVGTQDEIMGVSSESDEVLSETEFTPVVLGRKQVKVDELLDPNETKIMFLQLPIDLPIVEDDKDPLSTTTMNTNTTFNTVDTTAPLKPSKLPSGLIGSYDIYEDGRIVLKIGNVEFEVNQVKSNQKQTIVSIDKELKSMTIFGDVNEQLVVSPCIDSLL